MIQNLNKIRGGFTLVEIMIVVAIIAVVSSVAVPNLLRARKRSQATRILEDLRMIDSAIDQYAIETNRSPGDRCDWTDVQSYLKKGSALYNSAHTDVLGSDFGASFTVDTVVTVPSASFDTLSDVASAEFWSPFK